MKVKKKTKIGLIVIAVVLLLGYFGYQKLFNTKDSESETSQTQEYTVTLMDINQTYSTSGSVSSKVNEIIKAPFNSENFTLAVDVGDEVKKGDLIGTFDDSDIKIILLTQEKTVLNIESQLMQLKSEGNKSYFNAFESSRVSYENANESYEKSLELYNAGAISFSELEASKDAMNNAQHTYNLNSSRYYGFNLQDEIEILEKTLEVEKIRLEQFENDYDKVNLLAENDGTVVDLFVGSGDYVNAGQNLYQIMDFSMLQIVTGISEYEIKDIREGQEVVVTILGDDSVRTMGNISKIYPSAFVSGNDVTVSVVIDLIDPDKALKPGFSTNIEIMIASKKNAKVVPYDALTSSPKGQIITKIVDDVEKMIPVKTGVESDLMIEIISDEIKEGDTVKVMSTIDFSKLNDDNEMRFPGRGKMDDGGK